MTRTIEMVDLVLMEAAAVVVVKVRWMAGASDQLMIARNED